MSVELEIMDFNNFSIGGKCNIGDVLGMGWVSWKESSFIGGRNFSAIFFGSISNFESHDENFLEDIAGKSFEGGSLENVFRVDQSPTIRDATSESFSLWNRKRCLEKKSLASSNARCPEM